MKKEKEFKEAENPKTSYHQPVPARFVEEKPMYYYSRHSAILKEFNTSYYTLSDLFRSETEFFMNYMKDNKLKLRREKDLVHLFEYINTVIDQ